MAGMEGLGRLFNVVAGASGIHIPMDQASGITFVSFLDAGTQTVTLRESVDGASEQLLPALTKYYKAPGVGGTWTRVDIAAASAITLADAVNDTIAFFVGAAQLSDGFTCLEVTASSGSLIAITHDLRIKRAPENLARTVV